MRYDGGGSDRSLDAIDRANDLDRDWFAEHPNADERIRAVVPGEFWPRSIDADTLVRVVRVAPGLRARTPLLAAVQGFEP
jgi:hypothetical protein